MNATPPQTPRIATLDPRATPGYWGPPATPDMLPVGTLEDVFAKQWNYDAHILGYQVEGDSAWPRLTTSCIGDLRKEGVRITQRVIVLDLDTPGHVPLTCGQARDLAVVAANLPNLWGWHTTKHGAHFVFLLDRPLELEEVSPFQRGLAALIDPFLQKARGLGAGWHIDQQAMGWARPFRLPFVTRDGRPTTPLEQAYPGKILPVASVTPQGHRSSTSTALDRHAPILSDEGFRTGVEGKVFRRKVKKALAGLLPDVWGTLKDPPEPLDLLSNRDGRGRDGAQYALVGATVGKLFGWATPEQVYGLHYGQAEVSLRRGDPEDLRSKLWIQICRLWGVEGEKRAQVEEIQEEVAKDLASEVAQAPGDGATPALILVGTRVYALQPSGLYGLTYTVKTNVRALLRDNPLWAEEGPYSLEYTDDKGTHQKTPNRIIDEHAEQIGVEILFQPGPQGAWIDRSNPQCPRLAQGTFQRDPELTPQHDPEIEGWLDALVGPDQRPQLDKWIGLALAYERGPLCALSLVGPPGIGKQLFVRGLSEALSPSTLAMSDVFGKWKDSLETALIVNVDEGFPQGTETHISDTFRSLTGGDPIALERKYQAHGRVACPYRVVLTANNPKLLGTLFSARGMTSEDHAALRSRILHFDCSANAKAWLDSHGNRLTTNTWVQSPEKKLARHFLHLYHKHGQEGGAGRFLMPGNLSHKKVRELEQSKADSRYKNEIDNMGEVLAQLGGLPKDTQGRDRVGLKLALKAWRGKFDPNAGKARVKSLCKFWWTSPPSQYTVQGGGRGYGFVLDLEALKQAGHLDPSPTPTP